MLEDFLSVPDRFGTLCMKVLSIYDFAIQIKFSVFKKGFRFEGCCKNSQESYQE